MESPPVIAKTDAERLAKMRERRTALGLERHDVYVHKDDWPEVKKLVLKLRIKREKAKELK